MSVGRPVIVVAAARSGSKLLRDILAASPELHGFPWDVNYLWTYGNYDRRDDELEPTDGGPAVRAFIRGRLSPYSADRPGARILDKTVSNSLRVAYVRSVLPDCQFIHLIRDGRDVAASARARWRGSPLDGGDQSRSRLVSKLRSFPVGAAWPYLHRYLRDQVARLGGRGLPSWGPRFRGIDARIAEVASGQLSLIELCALQWQRSIERSLAGLAELREGSDFHTVRYENLVRDPVTEVSAVASFLGLGDAAPLLEFAATVTEPSFMASYRRRLNGAEIDLIQTRAGKTLRSLGYDSPAPCDSPEPGADRESS